MDGWMDRWMDGKRYLITVILSRRTNNHYKLSVHNNRWMAEGIY